MYSITVFESWKNRITATDYEFENFWQMLKFVVDCEKAGAKCKVVKNTNKQEKGA